MSPTIPSARSNRLPSCSSCKERHVKCGKERPVCSQCQRAKHHIACIYESKRPIRFKYSKASKGLEQAPPQNVPTERDDRHGGLTIPTKDSQSRDDLRTFEPQNTSAEHSPHEAVAGPWPVNATAPESIAFGDHDISPHRARIAGSGAYSLSGANDPPANVRVLSNQTECDLFAFYQNSIGSWLDIASPHQYFQSQIPRIALTEPLLFFACLACSAQVMALRGEIDKSVEQYYSGKVLELLIPLLSSDLATASNEALLATTVVLRMSEQFTEAESDALHHLNGAASLFSDGKRWSLTEVNLGTVAFWTHLREYIRACFLFERPGDRRLHDVVDENAIVIPADAPEEAWTNKMTLLIKQVLYACWGDAESSTSMAELDEHLRQWKASLPSSFQPWCFSDEGESPFPRIQCLETWHVVAWQFYYAANIMLAVYRTDDRPGLNLLDIRRRIEDEVITPTRLLCGVSIASAHDVGIMLNGSHLMAWAGQFLYDREERRCLEEVLGRFHEVTKWPTQGCLQKLRQKWEQQKGSGLVW